jgi:hypothetical protein
MFQGVSSVYFSFSFSPVRAALYQSVFPKLYENKHARDYKERKKPETVSGVQALSITQWNGNYLRET